MVLHLNLLNCSCLLLLYFMMEAKVGKATAILTQWMQQNHSLEKSHQLINPSLASNQTPYEISGTLWLTSWYRVESSIWQRSHIFTQPVLSTCGWHYLNIQIGSQHVYRFEDWYLIRSDLTGALLTPTVAWEIRGRGGEEFCGGRLILSIRWVTGLHRDGRINVK